MRRTVVILVVALMVSLGSTISVRAEPGEVVINEVAWGGTAASPFDEWIELRNNTQCVIDLTGWRLISDDGSPVIKLTGIIPAGEFYLLERTNDHTISDIQADQIYTGALSNSGERLELLDRDGNGVDTANGNGGAWPAGTGKPLYISMERVDPRGGDTFGNWKSNNLKVRNGLDAEGNLINGTPGKENSTSYSDNDYNLGVKR